MSERKLVKMLRKLNEAIDEDREKLCDRIGYLELSHNRMYELLKACKCYIEQGDSLDERQKLRIRQALDRELERKVL